MYYEMSLRAQKIESFSANYNKLKKTCLNISKIITPTLIEWGKQDKLFDISLLDNFKKIPNAMVAIYDHCGQFLCHKKKFTFCYGCY